MPDTAAERILPIEHVGDIDIHYEITGEGENLLLIHGLGSRSEDWEFQVPELAKHFRVITCDVRGHGRSSKPAAPYSVSLFAADIAGLLDALNTGPVHIVGLSMGGMIAFQLMADRPELVRSVVIANSGPALVPQTAAQRKILRQRQILVRFLGMRLWAGILAKRLFPEADQGKLRRTFVQRMSANDKRAYMNTQNSLIGWSVLDRVPLMQHRTLVLASDQDYTPVAAKEAYVRLMPNARLQVLTDARHAAPMEKPAEFNRAVLDFLLEKQA